MVSANGFLSVDTALARTAPQSNLEINIVSPTPRQANFVFNNKSYPRTPTPHTHTLSFAQAQSRPPSQFGFDSRPPSRHTDSTSPLSPDDPDLPRTPSPLDVPAYPHSPASPCGSALSAFSYAESTSTTATFSSASTTATFSSTSTSSGGGDARARSLSRRRAGSGSGECRPKKGDEDYIKRPENAFILFRRARCEERLALALTSPSSPAPSSHPSLPASEDVDPSTSASPTSPSTTSPTTTTAHPASPLTAKVKKQRQADLSKAISEQWRALSKEDRAHWEDRAREKKREHEARYPHYVYRPQRKEGKKNAPRRSRAQREADEAARRAGLPVPSAVAAAEAQAQGRGRGAGAGAGAGGQGGRRGRHGRKDSAVSLGSGSDAASLNDGRAASRERGGNGGLHAEVIAFQVPGPAAYYHFQRNYPGSEPPYMGPVDFSDLEPLPSSHSHSHSPHPRSPRSPHPHPQPQSPHVHPQYHEQHADEHAQGTTTLEFHASPFAQIHESWASLDAAVRSSSAASASASSPKAASTSTSNALSFAGLSLDQAFPPMSFDTTSSTDAHTDAGAGAGARRPSITLQPLAAITTGGHPLLPPFIPHHHPHPHPHPYQEREHYGELQHYGEHEHEHEHEQHASPTELTSPLAQLGMGHPHFASPVRAHADSDPRVPLPWAPAPPSEEEEGEGGAGSRRGSVEGLLYQRSERFQHSERFQFPMEQGHARQHGGLSPLEQVHADAHFAAFARQSAAFSRGVLGADACPSPMPNSNSTSNSNANANANANANGNANLNSNANANSAHAHAIPEFNIGMALTLPHMFDASDIDLSFGASGHFEATPVPRSQLAHFQELGIDMDLGMGMGMGMDMGMGMGMNMDMDMGMDFDVDHDHSAYFGGAAWDMTIGAEEDFGVRVGGGAVAGASANGGAGAGAGGLHRGALDAVETASAEDLLLSYFNFDQSSGFPHQVAQSAPASAAASPASADAPSSPR